MIETHDTSGAWMSVVRAERYYFDIANHTAPAWFRYILQNGMMTCTHLHHHSDAEFLYLYRGHLHVEINCTAYQMGAGDLLIIHPYELHAAKFDPADIVDYCFAAFHFTSFTGLSSTAVKQMEDLQRGSLRFPTLIRSGSAATALGKILTDICENKQHKESLDSAAEFKQMSLLCALMSELLCRVGFLDTKTEKQYPSRDYAFMIKVARFLDENYMRPLSTAEISAQFGYNKSYFCTLFKHCFGVSFSNYLTSYRISRSTIQYFDGTLNMSEIAERVGFSDYSRFSRSFRKLVGVSPSEYFKSAADSKGDIYL